MNSISKILPNAAQFCAAVVVSVLGFSSISHATPGDVLCVGLAQDGATKIEVLLGYENFEQETASFIDVSMGGKKVASFPKGSISAGYVEVGTPEVKIMNYQQSAKDGDATVTLRYPEQDPEAESLTIYLSLEVPAQKNVPAVLLKEVELNCPF